MKEQRQTKEVHLKGDMKQFKPFSETNENFTKYEMHLHKEPY